MNKEFMAIVHVGDKLYLVDREAYYLLCRLQEPELNEEKGRQTFSIVCDWLIERGKAIPLENNPIHLIPKFKVEDEE